MQTKLPATSHFALNAGITLVAVMTLVAPLSGLTAADLEVCKVSAETRLDWLYPVLGKSPATAPSTLLEGYRSTSQTYELFVPNQAGSGVALPLVIFVSPWDRGGGWSIWEPTCRTNNVMFAGLRDMGNGQPTHHRVRAVLDVLDDLREKFAIDPDRTYLAGFSGGAHIACLTACAVPEYFGGVVCLGHAPPPPQEPWQLERVRERLSLAIICGERDASTPLVEDLFAPWWQGTDVSVEVAFMSRVGHVMPDQSMIEDVWQWLEAAVGTRRAAAANRPSLRIADAPGREQWAERQLADAQKILSRTNPAKINMALQQLHGLVQRWPDVPAAKTARSLLEEYARQDSQPWDLIRGKQQLKQLRLCAEGYDRLACDGRQSARSSQGRNAQQAIKLWQQLRNATGDANLIAEADERIAALEEVANHAPEKSLLVPLNRFRFKLDGEITLAQGIEYLRHALASLGYELRCDEAALQAAGVEFDKSYHPQIKAGRLSDLDRKFFRRAGVRMQRSDNVVEILPVGR